MNSLLRIIPVVLSRLVFIGFAVIATISIPEARKLLNEDYEREGDTLLIPMKICKPTGITLDEKTVTLDAEVGDECHTMDFLANACAMSFIFSIVATAIFVISDLVVRRGMGNSGVVCGMGLFLVFILLQTAVCTWALVSESLFWIEYMGTVFDEHFQEYGIDNVITHGNSWMLMATGGSAALSAALLVLEALLSLCCSSSTKTKNETDTGANEKAATSDSQLPAVEWETTEVSGSDGNSSGRDTPTDVESEAKHTQPAWASTNGWSNPF